MVKSTKFSWAEMFENMKELEIFFSPLLNAWLILKQNHPV